MAVVLSLASCAHPLCALAQPAPLKRGINVVHWFRFPPARDGAALGSYVSDATLVRLRQAGFTFLRIPVQPEVLAGADGNLDAARVAVLVAQLRRVQKAGLAVMPELHPQTWHLETSAAARARLVAIWRDLAVAFRSLDRRLTFPEILNEPVFPDTAAWEALQANALAAIRSSLPGVTVVLSGTHWSDIDGLLKATPPPDRNIVYAVHFYEPYLLSVGAPEEPAVDQAALGPLPFPAADRASCEAIAGGEAAGRTRDLMKFYCSLGYDEAKVRERFQQAAAWSARTRVGLVFNEFGIAARVNPTTRRAWLAAVTRVMAADGFGWALWGYDDSMGFDLPIAAARDDAPLPQDLLTALGLD